MDIYRRGGDSLMGRYFSYRMHPFFRGRDGELGTSQPDRVVRLPEAIETTDFEALWIHGGYPEPFPQARHPFQSGVGSRSASSNS